MKMAGYVFNPFLCNYPFLSPLKYQKTFGFLMFSGGSKGNIGRKRVKPGTLTVMTRLSGLMHLFGLLNRMDKPPVIFHPYCFLTVRNVTDLAETFSKLSQTSNIKSFAKIVHVFNLLAIFTKSSILAVWLGFWIHLSLESKAFLPVCHLLHAFLNLNKAFKNIALTEGKMFTKNFITTMLFGMLGTSFMLTEPPHMFRFFRYVLV